MVKAWVRKDEEVLVTMLRQFKGLNPMVTCSHGFDEPLGSVYSDADVPMRKADAGKADSLSLLNKESRTQTKALENRITDSKREMDILDAPQDIRARDARNERAGNTVDVLPSSEGSQHR
ncbi:hypothetical protein ARMGADRAFT_1110718 [Armillaria gallica]|uniref:Uncharacterized protein n=1 Tax=Armillaria gallica TaxID=47427 RepID=A0A2H3E6G9_ARMGA|nr:hypothetical protein ARMGADRAFT_1110718 [Armillaria gallica]